MPSRLIFAGVSVAFAFSCRQAAAQTKPGVDLQRELWTSIRRELTGPNAQEYFSSSMKDAMLPTLEGTLISDSIPISGRIQSDERNLPLGPTDSTHTEVVLVLKKLKLEGELKAGSQIEFDGVAVGFTKDPFQVVFEVEDIASAPIPAFGTMASSWYFGTDHGQVWNGTYHNGRTGVEFQLPANWSVQYTRPSSVNSDLAILTNAELTDVQAAVWMVRDKVGSAEISSRLENVLSETTAQRMNLADYTIRPESVKQTWIGGQHALQALADYQDGGMRMSESLCWIVTEHARVLFFARTAADKLPALQSWFDNMVYTAFVP